ncbi:MAG: N-acetylmuramoyl-L-alanine amidase [Phycisphaerales bacterium]|nr:N-acetylmuramoyl-L-alanine amidase [Phycisphaerales bacterium]
MQLPAITWTTCLLSSLLLTSIGCHQAPHRLARQGTEIMVCGQLYDIDAPVILWTDPGGYDAYRTDRRFVPWEESGWEKSHTAGVSEPSRYNLRYSKSATTSYTTDQLERIRGGGWDLSSLQQVIDQFVLHYDVCGTSRTCFQILHDLRGLSIHFLLDIDGTIYQTLDVKERAWHATISNDRSIGIEIANIGAYPLDPTPTPTAARSPLDDWYATDESGRTRITIPARLGDGGIRTLNFIGRPARDLPIAGTINGSHIQMYDFTPQQYESLTKLTAALCTLFPAITPDFPRDPDGSPRTTTLSTAEWETYRGILGHCHIQQNKLDPGPAMRWNDLLAAVRKRMNLPQLPPRPTGTRQSTTQDTPPTATGASP